MHHRSVFAAAVIVAAACSVERKRDSTTDTSGPAPSASSTDTTMPPATSTPSDTVPNTGWTVTPSGIGAIRVGMSVDDLRRVAGNFDAPKAGAECSYVRPGMAPPGVLVMLARGTVSRVDVDSAGVRTDAGIAVGDSASRVTAAYAGRVAATPHKYVQGGQYLIVRATSPADSTLRIVFETDSGRVTRFRSGRVPQVEWVERCG